MLTDCFGVFRFRLEVVGIPRGSMNTTIMELGLWIPLGVLGFRAPLRNPEGTYIQLFLVLGKAAPEEKHESRV